MDMQKVLYIYVSFTMPKYNQQLTVSNLPNYLGQINANSSPDTEIKFLCRSANCLMKSGHLKNTKKAIRLYTQAYDIQSDIRGSSHTRSMNILNSIVKCENIVMMLKKNSMETRRRLKLEAETRKKKEKEMKMKMKMKKEKKVNVNEN
jgi:hypothetical protein